MFTSVAWLLAGFVALYYGAEWLVEGAVTIANRTKISKAIAGVILVAFGTSAPELFVNGIAALQGETGLALANVSGSNLTNLLIGFGLCGVLSQLPVDATKFRHDLWTFTLAPLVLLVVMWVMGHQLPIWGGGLLVLCFATYLYLVKNRLGVDDEEDEPGSLKKGIVWFIVGISLLYVGGSLTVNRALEIGEFLSIDKTILGLTVVAIGTSIPDVMASVIAAREGENDIAVGNLLGSNIFNVLFIISTTSLLSLRPLVGNFQVTLSYLVVVIASGAFFVWTARSGRLSRGGGGLMILCYFAYIIYRIQFA